MKPATSLGPWAFRWANINFARLNHVLIPGTKEGRDRLRETRFARLILGPLGRTYFAMTQEGRGLLALAAVACLLGLDVSRGQNYLLWSMAFSLLVGSLLVRPLFRLGGVSIEVDGPARISVGQEALFRVELNNEGARGHHSLRVRTPFLPWDGQWREVGDACVDELPARGRVSLALAARFVARGRHHIDAFSVGALAPLGLVIGPQRHSRGTRFVVTPRIAPVAHLPVSERPIHQPGGVALASHTGESLELVGLRPYRDGDRLRDIHARSWARLGTPVVREYQQEYFSRVAVVVDGRVGEVLEADFEAGISLAAGVLEYLARGDALIDLFTLESESRWLTLGRSLAGLDQGLDRLAELGVSGGFEADACFEAIAPHLDAVSGVVFISNHWDDERRAFVGRLRERGAECRSVVVRSEPVGAIGSPAPPLDGVVVLDSAAVARACESGEGIVL